MSGRKEAFTYVEEKNTHHGIVGSDAYGRRVRGGSIFRYTVRPCRSRFKHGKSKCKKTGEQPLSIGVQWRNAQNVKGLKINQSTRQDVYDKIGEPEQKADSRNPFDLYSWNMGNPGYGFSYHRNGKISEIRYFGTGVERRLNLGSVTPDILSKQIGSADKILTVPKTGETDYVYHTGQYELHFVIGSDQKADHVNLKAR